MESLDEAPSAPRTRIVQWEDPALTAAGMAGRTGLEFLQALAAGELPPPPILHTIGAALVSVEAGRVVFALEPAEYHYNPIGSVHGGVYATILDSAMGCVVQSMLPASTGYTSIDLSVKFLGAIRLTTGRVICTGTVTHLGKRTALAEATLTTEAGKLLATGTSSCLIFPV